MSHFRGHDLAVNTITRSSIAEDEREMNRSLLLSAIIGSAVTVPIASGQEIPAVDTGIDPPAEN